jgi:hypothetical protein
VSRPSAFEEVHKWTAKLTLNGFFDWKQIERFHFNTYAKVDKIEFPANFGARIGITEDVKDHLAIAWIYETCHDKAFKYTKFITVKEFKHIYLIIEKGEGFVLFFSITFILSVRSMTMMSDSQIQ